MGNGGTPDFVSNDHKPCQESIINHKDGDTMFAINSNGKVSFLNGSFRKNDATAVNTLCLKMTPV